jgi:hypothetical protein
MCAIFTSAAVLWDEQTYLLLRNLQKYARSKWLTLPVMLSEKEKAFMEYWKANREKKRETAIRMREGLQPALLFALPVIVLLIAVWVLFPDWYMKISKTSSSALVAVVVALVLVIVFYAFFKTQHDWERQEQQYRELLEKNNGHEQNPVE